MISSHARPNLAEVSETSAETQYRVLGDIEAFPYCTSAASILFKLIVSKVLNKITLEALITEYSNITT